MSDAIVQEIENAKQRVEVSPYAGYDVAHVGHALGYLNQRIVDLFKVGDFAAAEDYVEERKALLASPEGHRAVTQMSQLTGYMGQKKLAELSTEAYTFQANFQPKHLEQRLKDIGMSLNQLADDASEAHWVKQGVPWGMASRVAELHKGMTQERAQEADVDEARRYEHFFRTTRDHARSLALVREEQRYVNGFIQAAFRGGEATQDPWVRTSLQQSAQLAKEAGVSQGTALGLFDSFYNSPQADKASAEGASFNDPNARMGHTLTAFNTIVAGAERGGKPVPGYFTALEALQASGAWSTLTERVPRAQEQAAYIAQVAPFAAQPWLQYLDEGTRGVVHKVQLRAQGAPVTVTPEEEQRAQSALRKQTVLTVAQTEGGTPSLQGAALVADSILHGLLDTPTQRPVEGDARTAVERIQAYQLAHQLLDETESRLSSALLEVGNFESQEQAMQAMHQVANLGLLLHPRSDPARAAVLAGRVLASQDVAVEQLGIEIQGDELVKALQAIASYSEGGALAPDNALDRAQLDAQRIRRPGSLLSSESQAQELFSQYREVGGTVASMLTDLIERGGKLGWSSAEFLKVASGWEVKLPDGKFVTLGVLAERNPTFAKLLQGIAAGDHLTFKMPSGATWHYGTPEPSSTEMNVLTAVADSLSTLLLLPKSTDWAVPAFQPNTTGYTSRSLMGKAGTLTAYQLGEVGSLLWGRKGVGAQIYGGIGDMFSQGHYHRTVNDPFGFTDLVTDLFASQGTVSPMPVSGKVGVNPDVSYQTKHTGGGGIEAVAAARKSLASVLEKQGANSPKLQYMLELAPVAAAKEIIRSHLTFDQKYHGAAYHEAVQAFFPPGQKASTPAEVVEDARAGLKSQWEAQALIDIFNREADRQSRERQPARAAQVGLQRAQVTADTQRYRVDETEAGRDRRFQPRH